MKPRERDTCVEERPQRLRRRHLAGREVAADDPKRHRDEGPEQPGCESEPEAAEGRAQGKGGREREGLGALQAHDEAAEVEAGVVSVELHGGGGDGGVGGGCEEVRRRAAPDVDSRGSWRRRGGGGGAVFFGEGVESRLPQDEGEGEEQAEGGDGELVAEVSRGDDRALGIVSG